MEEYIVKIKDESKRIIGILGFEVDPIVSQRDRAYVINIQVDDPSLLIGRGGEVLESLQHVLRLLLRDVVEEGGLIVIDVNGYREKKSKMLEAKAKELAYSVRERGIEIELMPMNSFERKIIHTTVALISDVTSESRGDRSERRVVIKPKKSK